MFSMQFQVNFVVVVVFLFKRLISIKTNNQKSHIMKIIYTLFVSNKGLKSFFGRFLKIILIISNFQ